MVCEEQRGHFETKTTTSSSKEKTTTAGTETPTLPEQTVRRKELNRQACNRYRDSHREKVRAINRTYYHSNRERIV